MCLYKLKLLSLSCLLLFHSCRRFISRHHVSSFSSACSGRTLKSLNHISEHCSPMATCAGILFRIKNLSIQKKKITKQLQVGNLPCGHVCKINLFKQKDFFLLLSEDTLFQTGICFFKIFGIAFISAGLLSQKVRFSVFQGIYYVYSPEEKL